MCIAIYKPSGLDISRETLKTCYEYNPDGCGLAFLSPKSSGGNELVIYASMEFDEFHKIYLECLAENPNSPFLIHFRIATHGVIDESNCHPFFIETDGQSDKVFMHNGTISPVTHLCKASTGKSDTRVFGELVLESLPTGWMHSSGVKELIEEYIGWSKIVVMNDEGEVVIFNEEKGEWCDGVWYSNGTYKRPKKVKPTPTPKKEAADAPWFYLKYIDNVAHRWDYSINEWRACDVDGNWLDIGYQHDYEQCCMCDIWTTEDKLVIATEETFTYVMCKQCVKDYKDIGVEFTTIKPLV